MLKYGNYHHYLMEHVFIFLFFGCANLTYSSPSVQCAQSQIQTRYCEFYRYFTSRRRHIFFHFAISNWFYAKVVANQTDYTINGWNILAKLSHNPQLECVCVCVFLRVATQRWYSHIWNAPIWHCTFYFIELNSKRISTCLCTHTKIVSSICMANRRF